jgi:hypothetical protein
MQFHRIVKPQVAHRPSPHINHESICQICLSRPVAGYVIGTGQYLTKTCLKCYRAAGLEAKEREGQLKTFSRKARS